MNKSEVELYREIRINTKEQFEKVRNFAVDRNVINKTARMLGMMGLNNTVHYDSEDEINFMMDTCFFERINNKKSATEKYLESNKPINDFEKEVFEMFLNSYISAFIVTEVEREKNKIHLSDLFSDKKIDIIDIGLSKTAVSGLVIFFRYLKYKEIGLTSGVSYVYNFSDVEEVNREYGKLTKIIKEKDENIKKILIFKRLNNKYGLGMEFEDVE